jgi:hypothetical protein
MKGQALDWTGSGTSVSTTFGGETFHVRIISQINGRVAFEPSATQGTLMSTSTFAGGTYVGIGSYYQLGGIFTSERT